MSRKRVLCLASALTIAIGLTACSSSKTKGASSSSTSASPSAAGAPLKIGVICTCSGTFGAGFVDSEDVYKSWANTVNASGGIGGHPVELITEDDGGVPGTSVTDVHTLLSDGVVAIVDFTIVDQTWASTVQSANIPVVGGNVTEVPFYTNPDFYPQGTTIDGLGKSVAAIAKTAGAANFGYFYCAEAASCQEDVAVFKAAGQTVGVPLIYQAAISATAPNYTAQCVAAEQAHVAAIQIGDSASIAARVGADCSKQGYDPVYLTGGEDYYPALASSPGLNKNLWLEADNVPYFANTPAIQAMNNAVDKYYPGLREKATEWTGSVSTETWASGVLLEDGVKAGGLTSSGTPSSAEIVKGLQSLKGDTLQGMAPPLTFTAGQPHPVDCWFTFRIQNGAPTLVNGDKVSCASGS